MEYNLPKNKPIEIIWINITDILNTVHVVWFYLCKAHKLKNLNWFVYFTKCVLSFRKYIVKKIITMSENQIKYKQKPFIV